jgi:uncharacterized protein YaaN involved in tellurite resistance
MTAETKALVPAEQVPTHIVPQPPKEVGPELLQAAEAKAAALADQVLVNPGDLQTLSQLTRIGEDAQGKVSGFFEMRQVTVSEMMKKVGDGSHNPLPGQIKQMRTIMEKFDPRGFKDKLALAQKYGGKGLMKGLIRTLRGIPVMGELVRRIADQFTPIRDEIDGLLISMEGGLVRLDENNAAILTQSDELGNLIQEVALRAYEAETVFEILKRKHAAAPEAEQQKIMNAMARVGKRALYLRGNEQIFLQVLTGLRTSITTNFELRDTVAMMRDQAGPLLTNLYALIVVQQDARQIAEAAAATQEMVTDLLQAGAEMTKENVEYVGALGVKMVSDLDKLIQSKETFLEAVAKADALAAQTVDAANKSIPVFQEASAELRKVVQEHQGADVLETSSN